MPTKKQVEWLSGIFIDLPITEVVSGGAHGADRLGEHMARNRGITIETFYAQWKLYGRPAGPMRNQKMAEYADACILFPGGKGTADMKDKAIAAGLKIIEWSEE